MNGTVLLVDDDVDLCEAMTSALELGGYRVVSKGSAEAALDALEDEPWDVVVTDISLGRINGLALCERVVANRPHLPVILFTAFGSLDTAVAAVRAGAYDFVAKPFDRDALLLALARAVRHHRVHDEVQRLREVVTRSTQMDGMIGTSPAIRQVYELIDRVCSSEASVHISGPTGTGKELVARALHNRGPRSAGPFVAVNCAAIPDALLESELFGHVKGAFTDARGARRGLFLKAQGGTLFLDEVTEMSAEMQSKLLRVLQDKMVRAVGADHEESFDARLITASNRDLEAEVHEKRLRDDLYYRICVIRIDVPPLRLRGNDVLLLAQHFLVRAAAQLKKRVAGISGPAAAKLLAYAWPGNVRELENCIERAVALARTGEISVDDLPEKIRDYHDYELTASGSGADEILPLEEVERRHILRALATCDGSKTAAAALLGVHVSTLYRKLDRYRIRTELDAKSAPLCR